LAVKHQVSSVVVVINDGMDADNDLIVGEAESYDASQLFTGGLAPVTYKPEAIGTHKANITVENTDGGAMLTITIEDAAGNRYSAADAAAANNLMDNTRFDVTVTATDAAGVQVETTIHVIRNRPPMIPTGAAEMPNLNIGTQMAEKLAGSDWPGGNDYVCDMMNTCVLTLTHADSNGHFQDDDETLTYSAVSADTSKVQVSTNDDGKIVVMGVASTERDDDTAEMFDSEGVTITVTATDEGDLTSDERTFKVLVNAQPARSDVAIPAVKLETEAGRPIDMSLFVEDNDMISYTVQDNTGDDGPFPHVTVSSPVNNVVTFTPTANGLNGTRVVTIRAAEPEGQNITPTGSVGQYLDFTITVENAQN
jgi:hypothetical protein